MVQGIDLFSGLGRVCEHAMLFENTKAGQQHGTVDGEGSTQVGGQTVLADTRVAARGKEIVLQTTLDHPPANDALKANHAADGCEFPCHGGGDLAACDKVDGGHEEGQADDSAPQAMSPLHEIDVLELGEGHAGIEHLEFGRRAVLCELALPVGVVHGRQRAGDGPPFSDAQSVANQSGIVLVNWPRRGVPGLCKSRQATEYDDAEDAGGAAEQPVCNALGACLGPGGAGCAGTIGDCRSN